MISMQKLIMLKYGELSTKKGNINLFLNTLKNNIKFKLNDHSEIKFDKGRMFIYPKSSFDEVLNKLKEVFGIHEIEIAYELETNDLEMIKSALKEQLSNYDFKTFKVQTKRSDKSYYLDSMAIGRNIGGFILKNFSDIKVDVHNPEITVNVEIRKNASYFYFEKVAGIGGYPVGVLGKGMLMLSGGIDSPVAGYMTIKRGVKLEAVYFESPPHTSIEAKNKVISLAKKLAVYNNDIKLHVINFTNIQEAIYKNIPHEYLITIMRRMMYRISAKIAYSANAKILVNGESIGQVASQTLNSMSVINEVVKMPVIRPLACFDKLEIIEVAKKIDTYETSILPYEDCCTIFVPKHPVINPELSKAIEYEKLIDYETLIYEAVKNREIIKLTNNKDNSFDDIL